MSELKSLLQLEFDSRIDFYVMFGFFRVEIDFAFKLILLEDRNHSF
jgi:hypothetical protein